MPTTKARFAIWTYDEALFEAIHAAARRHGRKPSDVVEDAVRRYLATLAIEEQRQEQIAALMASTVKTCPICDQPFRSATQRQIYCGAGNRRCMKYAQRYGVEHGRRMYAAKHPPVS